MTAASYHDRKTNKTSICRTLQIPRSTLYRYLGALVESFGILDYSLEKREVFISSLTGPTKRDFYQ
jgi:hypothetical protein